MGMFPKTDFVAEPEEMDGALGDVAEGDEDEEPEFQDDELPEWARRDRFQDDKLGMSQVEYQGHANNFAARLHALLTTHLPPNLLNHLPPYGFKSADREPFLTRLSDGQLLCVGYNAVVRRSRKQWGFIGTTSIHDILALEEKERAAQINGTVSKKPIGWTFRRAENLRLWAA